MQLHDTNSVFGKHTMTTITTIITIIIIIIIFCGTLVNTYLYQRCNKFQIHVIAHLLCIKIPFMHLKIIYTIIMLLVQGQNITNNIFKTLFSWCKLILVQ